MQFEIKSPVKPSIFQYGATWLVLAILSLWTCGFLAIWSALVPLAVAFGFTAVILLFIMTWVNTYGKFLPSSAKSASDE